MAGNKRQRPSRTTTTVTTTSGRRRAPAGMHKGMVAGSAPQIVRALGAKFIVPRVKKMVKRRRRVR